MKRFDTPRTFSTRRRRWIASFMSLASMPVLAFASGGTRTASGFSGSIASGPGGVASNGVASGSAGAAPRTAASPAILAFEPQTFTQILAAAGDRPLIVHLWGLTCAPCIEELPRWAEFVRSRSGADTAFIQVDPMPVDRVESMLLRAGLAHARHWSASARMDERWRYRIDPDWNGELPRNLLIADGQRRKAISGRVDFGELRSWLSRDVAG